MFWVFATCFSNRRVSAPLIFIRSDSFERNLHPPKQRHLAVAHTQAKHLRPAGQTLTAKLLRPLRKNQTNVVRARSTTLAIDCANRRNERPTMPPKENTMRTQQGFSLIELMVVVAIIGIIAVIAVPSYQGYVVKGNRAAAQAFMVDVTNREKQYLLDARAYTNSFATLGISAPADVSRHYANIAITCTDGVSAATGCTIVANSPPTFTITATPTSTQQIGDGWLSLTNDGTKGSQFSGKW